MSETLTRGTLDSMYRLLKVKELDNVLLLGYKAKGLSFLCYYPSFLPVSRQYTASMIHITYHRSETPTSSNRSIDTSTLPSPRKSPLHTSSGRKLPSFPETAPLLPGPTHSTSANPAPYSPTANHSRSHAFCEHRTAFPNPHAALHSLHPPPQTPNLTPTKNPRIPNRTPRAPQPTTPSNQASSASHTIPPLHRSTAPQPPPLL